ncbi:uncharacterized protein LOC122935406 [Bufo gargarizans]|uniref:uncharacterized protein LOC122935406 n=1 Tax=Bufo gargarizans TaxID=30331 RepID=UPI001CF4F834|nr:uncharacterized protein LOC122935406 [Bufo gargarizans]
MEIDYSTLKRSTLKDLLEARGISASNKTKATLISEIMAEIRAEDDSVTAQRDETDGTEQAEFQRQLLFRLSFYGENPPVEIISKTMTEVQEFITRQRRPQTPSPAVSMVQEDASMFGLGAVLSQVGADGGEHPVAYISRKLLPREVSYAAIEKECLAVVWALKKLQPYLYGQAFSLLTDHNPLVWLNRVAGDNARLLRWSLALQPFDFNIQYRPGKQNGNADGLSRQTDLEK